MRAFPKTGVDEACAALRMPVMNRRVPRRLDLRADFMSRNGAQRHWRVRRPKRGGTDLRYRHVEQLSHQRESEHVAGLALIGTHAERRVALQMLDRLVVLARGESDVADGDIVLQVNKTFVGLAASGHRP